MPPCKNSMGVTKATIINHPLYGKCRVRTKLVGGSYRPIFTAVEQPKKPQVEENANGMVIEKSKETIKQLEPKQSLHVAVEDKMEMDTDKYGKARKKAVAKAISNLLKGGKIK
jgi:hypothetical protein